MIKTSLRRFVSFLVPVVLILTAAGAFAQDLDDVTIAGRITDSNGLAVVGAAITVTEQASGTERTVTSNEQGRYRLIELKPGVYKVKAAATGFGAKERINLETVAGQNLQLDFNLSPADVQAQATVTVGDDDAPLVDTTRTIVGSTITERDIEEIPNASRNPLDLILTLGGTSEEALSSRDLAEDTNQNNRQPPTEQGNFSVSGGASYSNNITIDGLDNNDDLAAGSRFTPSLEAVAEVQLIRNQFSSEYGRASGGRINLRTRGGSNRFKGRAFMFYKNDNTNANTWYNNSRGFPRRDFVDYNPGFTFGGPVILPFGEGKNIYNGRDRTFFFVAYEFDKLDDTTLIDTWLPVAQNPNWILPAPTGPARFCDVTTLPPPCVGSVGALGEYSKVLDTPNRSNIFTARLDHRLFKGNELTIGYQFGRKKLLRTSSNSSLVRTEDAVQARRQKTDAINLTDNHVFGSKVVNQFRFQWSVFEPSFETDEAFAPVIIVGYTNPETGGGQSLVTGNSTTSAANSNIFSDSRRETRYQFQASLTITAGKQTWKAGFDLQKVNSRNIALQDATGTYNFGNVWDYSVNRINRYRQNFGTDVVVQNTYWGAFLNDEIALSSKLTLSGGIRYERETAVEDNDNWGPRVGVAWAPFSDGKGVIRVGAGIFYNRVLLRTIGNFIQNTSNRLAQFDTNQIPTANNWRNNVMASISQDFPNSYRTIEQLQAAISRSTCGPSACSPTLGFLSLNGVAGNPLRSVDPNLKIPESYQFNIGFEREIGKGWVFEANYTWNKTAHLWREYNDNGAVLPSGFADFTAWLLVPGRQWQFTNGNNTVRTYRFFSDPTRPTINFTQNPNNLTAVTCPNNASVTCWVNLGTSNNATTEPSTAVNGIGTNSIGSAIAVARQALRELRPNTLLDETERVISVGNAQYNGLVLEARSRYRKLGAGFRSSLRFVYTLSRMMDDGLNNTTNAEVGQDFGREWARARQDRLHRFTISGTVETPWWLGKLRVSPLFRYGSSAPFDLGTGVDRNLSDVSTDRPLFNGDLNDIVWREPGTIYPQALADQFTLPLIGALSGNLPRNAGRGPSMYLFDISLTREFRLSERMRLRPAVEVGNVLNARVFNYGSEFVNFFGATPTATQQAGFLVPSRTYRARDMRFGIRFDF
ncbi:MAG: carboxypeptidase regulatory-like domain-containing protein [Pyrinomonadaceae bacterium]